MAQQQSMSSLFSDIITPADVRKNQLSSDRLLGQALQQGNAATLFAPERARRLSQSFGNIVGADTRSPEEKQAEAIQAIARDVRPNDLQSMKQARDRLIQQGADAAIIQRFNAAISQLESKQAAVDAEANKRVAASNWLMEKDPELASAVEQGIIDPTAAVTAYRDSAGKTTVLKEGEVLLDNAGNIIAERPAKAGDNYVVLSDAEAKAKGLNTSGGQKYKMNTANNNIVSIQGNSMINAMSPPPSGYQYVSVLDENGRETVKAEPIAGTPQAKELEQQIQAVQNGTRNKGYIASIVTETIDEAIEVATNEDNWATGTKGALVDLAGKVTGGVASAGTSRKALETKLLTVKSNIGFDRLQKMREESPTGGALGQVAVQELNALQAGLGSLDPNLEAEELKDNLVDVKRQYASTASAVANAYTDEQLRAYGLSELIPYRTKNPDGTPLKDPDDETPKGEFDLKKLPKEVQDNWEFMSDEDKKLFGWKG